MRASGKSIFSIIKFSAFVAFLLGIFVVVFYNSISSYLNTESKRLTNLYLKGKNENFLESKNGIWFKQNNLKDNSGIIIIRASSAHKKELIFNDVILFYLDKNNNFLKRINTKTLTLNNNSWTAVDNYIIQNGEKSKFIKNIDISTNLNRNFIIKMIRNEYESEYNVYFLNLASSIKDLESSGFNTLKFKVRFYSLLFTPFLFSIMILISAYFGIVSSRENKKYLSLIKGITMGFIVFVSHTLIIEFANASKLTILDSSFFIVLIFVLLSVVLIMKKDLLSNYS
jgi:lipopolysaccharide export system permease protein